MKVAPVRSPLTLCLTTSLQHPRVDSRDIKNFLDSLEPDRELKVKRQGPGAYPASPKRRLCPSRPGFLTTAAFAKRWYRGAGLSILTVPQPRARAAVLLAILCRRGIFRQTLSAWSRHLVPDVLHAQQWSALSFTFVGKTGKTVPGLGFSFLAARRYPGGFFKHAVASTQAFVDKRGPTCCPKRRPRKSLETGLSSSMPETERSFDFPRKADRAEGSPRCSFSMLDDCPSYSVGLAGRRHLYMFQVF